VTDLRFAGRELVTVAAKYSDAPPCEAYKRLMTFHQGVAMDRSNRTKKLAISLIAAAGLSGCATMQDANVNPESAPVAATEAGKVLRPLPSYGTYGGYRYRRFAVTGA
jgi:hypothetical protein